MSNEDTSPPRRRVVIRATCTVHGGPVGFCNLVVRVLDGQVELDPHADGSCTLVLDEQAATELFVALGAWLG